MRAFPPLTRSCFEVAKGGVEGLEADHCKILLDDTQICSKTFIFKISNLDLSILVWSTTCTVRIHTALCSTPAPLTLLSAWVPSPLIKWLEWFALEVEGGSGSSPNLSSPPARQ